MKLYSQGILLLTTLLVTSCINLDKLFKTDYNTNTLNIPSSIESINFIDRRKYVSTGKEFILPVLSRPNQFIDYYPEFNSTHKHVVSDLIYKNFRLNSTNSTKITIELLEGVKEFSATFSKETERVKIKLRITITNDTGYAFTEAHGEYFVSSADAKYKRFEELYQRTLQAVTHKALEDLKLKYFNN